MKSLIFFSACLRRCFQDFFPNVSPRYQLAKSDYTDVMNFSMTLSEIKMSSTRPGTSAVRRRSGVARSFSMQIADETRRKDFERLSEVVTKKDMDVEFQVFAPKVFSLVRDALGIVHEEFVAVSLETHGVVESRLLKERRSSERRSERALRARAPNFRKMAGAALPKFCRSGGRSAAQLLAGARPERNLSNFEKLKF